MISFQSFDISSTTSLRALVVAKVKSKHLLSDEIVRTLSLLINIVIWAMSISW